MIRSYKAAQWTTCAFALFAALVSLLVFRGVGVPGHRNVQPPPQQDEERVSDEEEKEVKVDEESTEQ
jgi:hypothetical protein